MDNDVKISVTLTPNEAMAYAQFLKRIRWDTYEEYSASTLELSYMKYAGIKIQCELNNIGFNPR